MRPGQVSAYKTPNASGSHQHLELQVDLTAAEQPWSAALAFTGHCRQRFEYFTHSTGNACAVVTRHNESHPGGVDAAHVRSSAMTFLGGTAWRPSDSRPSRGRSSESSFFSRSRLRNHQAKSPLDSSLAGCPWNPAQPSILYSSHADTSLITHKPCLLSPDASSAWSLHPIFFYRQAGCRAQHAHSLQLQMHSLPAARMLLDHTQTESVPGCCSHQHVEKGSPATSVRSGISCRVGAGPSSGWLRVSREGGSARRTGVLPGTLPIGRTVLHTDWTPCIVIPGGDVHKSYIRCL